MARPLKFGICIDQNLPWDTTAQKWRQIEALGFDSVWDCDHYMQPSRPTGPYFEGWTLLAGLAAVTTTIRIGVLVSSNTFRHPALLAKMAATIDHISHGRVEVGLGAGWYVPEHEKFGLGFPAPGELVAQFHEAVEIVDLLLRQEITSYQGKYYQLHEAPFRPSPVQRPRPPLMLGGHKPRMLRICARYADAWNSFGSVDEMRQRNEILDEACAAIGRDPDAVSRSLYGWAAMLPDDPWASTDAFQSVVAKYRAVGVNEFIIDAPSDAQWAVMERVATDVLPKLRATAH